MKSWLRVRTHIRGDLIRLLQREAKYCIVTTNFMVIGQQLRMPLYLAEPSVINYCNTKNNKTAAPSARKKKAFKFPSHKKKIYLISNRRTTKSKRQHHETESGLLSSEMQLSLVEFRFRVRRARHKIRASCIPARQERES